jgi:hypothetical protein
MKLWVSSGIYASRIMLAADPQLDILQDTADRISSGMGV